MASSPSSPWTGSAACSRPWPARSASRSPATGTGGSRRPPGRSLPRARLAPLNPSRVTDVRLARAPQPGRASRPGRLEPGGLSRRRAWLVVYVIGWTFTVATGLGFYSLPVYLNVLIHSRGFGLTTNSYAVSAFFLISAVVNVPLGRLIRR